MDSDKWRQYSEKFSGVRRWIYGREAKMLLEEEAALAGGCDASVLISDDEVAVFCEQTGTPTAKVHAVPNGVDVDFFDPSLAYTDPYPAGRHAIVFVGAMDYWPNIDAVTWFGKSIFPDIKARIPTAEFYVVGSNPGREVLELQSTGGTTVTGRVDDVRPYLAFASCVVAPIRVARGVQNKVLEAMAMGKAVVATTPSFEGITYDARSGVLLCDTEADWVENVQSVIADSRSKGSAPGARRQMMEQYSWDASVRILADLVAGRRRYECG